MKNLQISLKFKWISRNLQITTILNIKKLQPNLLAKKRKRTSKCRTWTKDFVRLQFSFHTSNSRSLENSEMNKKLLSFRYTLHFGPATKSLQIFSRVSFPASKFTPIKLIKKGLLQYSSSSRKKTVPQNNSNPLNCKKEERLNNSHLRGWRRLWITTEYGLLN